MLYCFVISFTLTVIPIIIIGFMGVIGFIGFIGPFSCIIPIRDNAKKTATHPCSGLLVRTLPQLGTPLSAEFSAQLCCGLCTSTQTFGKSSKKNSKFKMQNAKLGLKVFYHLSNLSSFNTVLKVLKVLKMLNALRQFT